MDAITVAGVTKTYRIKVGRARIREMVPPPLDELPKRLFPNWWMRDTFNALSDVSLSIPPGESVGIVGHNGAGKTTLLKIISGVTQPTRGSVKVGGRIAALIDLLVGFNPDLTGRENAYLLGSMYGFGRRAISTKIDQMLDFAEVSGDLIETPIKRYSAGMMARLGFAVITALGADIILVDEVLAVGDSSFQRKCTRWLDDYRAQGGTLVFVSHNLGLIRSMTKQVICLDHGRLIDQGPTPDVLVRYAKAMERREENTPAHRRWNATKLLATQGLDRWGAGGARIEAVHFTDPTDGDPGMEVSITYESEGLDRGVFCVSFIDEGGHQVATAASRSIGLAKGGATIRCGIHPLPFRPGVYFPVVTILSDDGVVRDNWKLERAIVVDGKTDWPGDDLGPVAIGGQWSAGQA